MHSNLDLLVRCRGDTLGIRWKLSEPSVSDLLHTQSLHVWQDWHILLVSHCTCPALCIWVLSCWATEVHLQGSPSVHTTDLSIAVGQPFGDSANLPVNPTTFLIQPCGQNDHGAVESSRCRKQSGFPMKKNRDGVFVKGSVKFLPSFPQFHESAWVHGE